MKNLNGKWIFMFKLHRDYHRLQHGMQVPEFLNQGLREVQLLTGHYRMTDTRLYLVKNYPIEYLSNPLEQNFLFQFTNSFIALLYSMLDQTIHRCVSPGSPCRTAKLQLLVGTKALV